MPIASDIVDRLQEVTTLRVLTHVPLSSYTRFSIGGPADLFIETQYHEAFQRALDIAQESGLPHVVIAGGTNLIVSDSGFRGIVLRFTGERLDVNGMRIHVEAGAS